MHACNETIIFRAENVSREVKKNGSHLKLIDNISFQFNKGLVYNIVGPSGAGKSSFLRLMNRLDDPTDGNLYYYDRPLKSYAPSDLRKKIAMLFQTPYLFPGTVRDNIDYCCDKKSIGDVGFHLKRVGLKENMANSDTESLSVGEKQRVALARSLFLEPDILLLDEPTSALDPASSKKIEELILSLVKGLCLTAVIVTHNPEQALRLGGRTLLLVEGRLIETGETGKVLTNPETEQGKKYIDRELE